MTSRPVRIPILMYHRIDRPKRESSVPGHYVSPRLFARHMWALATLGYETVPLVDVFAEQGQPIRKPVVITFDDGYANFYHNALPVLRRHGFRSTVFLVADQIGGHNAWDTSANDAYEPLLGRTQILQAQSEGTQFGSHTLSHADLCACGEDEAQRQIVDSKQVIAELTGQPVSTFSYPYGRFTTRTRELVREAGYAVACTTLKRANTVATDRLALNRINVRRDTWLPVFALKLMRGAWLGR